MAKSEAQTDLWVARMLDDASIDYEYQGSTVLEINEALKTASKKGTGNVGYPEFVAVVDDFVVVIEDKASIDDHIRMTELGLLDMGTKAICEYASNGAVFYGKHIAQNSSFKKVFAVGVSGNEKTHRITPYFVNDREGYEELGDIDTFASFSPMNIVEYYTRNVLHEVPDEEKTTEEIIADAKQLHEYLYRYGALGDREKPIVVSGILLALDEIETGGFSIDSLKGDRRATDGRKISRAIEDRLKRSNVSPEDKRDKLMAEFALFRTNTQINTVHPELKKTPLRFYTEFLYERVYKNIKAQTSSEDFIGRFYGEFVSYSGGDGQALGVVLTPKHICDLFCDLVDIKPDDVVLDPCCGSAAFLVAAMHHMLAKATEDDDPDNIKTQQLHGFELRSDMFTIAVTNMILREDGNSNIQQTNFITQQPAAKVQLKGATVGMMNPPYSQGSVRDAPELFEICFVEHLLDCLALANGGKRSRAVVIVPQSVMTGKSRIEKQVKASILQHHTLEGVITCNTDTFYGVGTNPVIAVFTAHKPHPKNKKAKFIDFRDDGYRVHAHVGLVEEADAVDKRAHLLAVWRGEQQATTSFCVDSTVEPDDEWLHSFYYFNDAIPTDADFERAIGDYLTFEFSMIMQNREYLFTGGDK